MPGVLARDELTQLAERMLCSEARVDSSALRRGQLQRQDMTNLTYAAATLSKAPILIDDTPALSLREVRARSRRFMKDKELFGKRETGLIIIDYLQLMRGSPEAQGVARAGDRRDLARAQVARQGAALSSPRALAAQPLARASADKRPQLSDLRESGAIEQDADVILFIYRDVVYHPDAENPNIAEVIIGKNRHGATGTIETHFEGRFTRFENVSRRDPPA